MGTFRLTLGVGPHFVLYFLSVQLSSMLPGSQDWSQKFEVQELFAN